MITKEATAAAPAPAPAALEPPRPAKPRRAWDEAPRWQIYLPLGIYLVFTLIPFYWILLFALRPAEDRTLQLLVKSPDGGEVTLTAPYPNEWDGQWHHIAMQWTPEEYSLVIDGAVVTRKPAVAEGMPAPDTRIAIGAHGRGVNVSDALIDELRISDVPRYR